MSFSSSAANSAALIRSEIWSQELKDVLEDELQATKYMRWLSSFPDGDEGNLCHPSLG